MNKQEAIEKIKKLEVYYGFSKGVYLEKRDVINIVSKIDEPQKVTVPKFVAEWYERNKDCLDPAIYSTITGTYRKVDGGNNDLL